MTRAENIKHNAGSTKIEGMAVKKRAEVGGAISSKCFVLFVLH